MHFIRELFYFVLKSIRIYALTTSKTKLSSESGEVLLSVYFCENRGVTREKNQVKVPVKKKSARENFHRSTRESIREKICTKCP